MKGKIHYVVDEKHILYGVCCDGCNRSIGLKEDAYELGGAAGSGNVNVVLCKGCIEEIASLMDLFCEEC